MGTGKSTVARLFADMGAQVIDADQLAREVVMAGSIALKEIQDRFGSEVLDDRGELDRSRLAEIIFQDQTAKADLERIVHPRVREKLRNRLEHIKRMGNSPVVIYESPLLYEAGDSLPMVRKVAVVYAPRDVQKERLMRKRGYSEEEAERRINAQMPTEGKAAKADYVIDNSGDLEETTKQVQRLWKEWRA